MYEVKLFIRSFPSLLLIITKESSSPEDADDESEGSFFFNHGINNSRHKMATKLTNFLKRNNFRTILPIVNRSSLNLNLSKIPFKRA